MNLKLPTDALLAAQAIHAWPEIERVLSKRARPPVVTGEAKRKASRELSTKFRRAQLWGGK